jgi:hypothetical protein
MGQRLIFLGLAVLSDLFVELAEGRYALPEVQRHYEWRNSQIRGLFESIYRGYPVGSIIVWSMPKEVVENYSDLLRPLTEELNDRRKNLQYLVIDGQQRLVSLVLAKYGSITVRDENGTRRRFLPLYFTPAEGGRFDLLGRKEVSGDSRYFKITDLLNEEKDIDDLLDEKGVSHSERSTLRRGLNEFRKRVLNYPVSIYLVPESTLRYDAVQDNFLEIFEKVSEMFVRLNMTGVRVKMPQLVLALLTAKTRKEYAGSFREEVSQISKKLTWDINEGVLIRSYMAIAADETNFRKAKETLEEMSAEEALRQLKRAGDSLQYACSNILEGELNIKSERYLKSQYSLVTLSYYVHKKDYVITPAEIEQIRRWLILASFNKRYTGRLESDLKEDIESLHKGESFDNLVGRLTAKEISRSNLDRAYDEEHLMVLLMLLKESYDLSGELVRLRNLSREDLHIHHIFPKNVLIKVYGRDGKIKDMDIESAFDHVANITYVSKKTNERISDSRPDEYLKELDESTIETHYIPTDPELWKPEKYYEFLQKRTDSLLEGVNNLLK